MLLGPFSGVTPGTYGSDSAVGQFTVDAQGRITLADNVPIASSAGGTVTSVDVSGGTTGLTTTGGPVDAAGVITLDGTLGIANGGTGATTANDALNALLPAQTVNKFLQSDGTNATWVDGLTVVTAPTASGDAGSLGQVAIATGKFYFHDGTQWLEVAGAAF